MLQHTHIQSYKHSFMSAERERCCRLLVVEACGWVGTMMMRIMDLVFKINFFFFFFFGYNIGVFVCVCFFLILFWCVNHVQLERMAIFVFTANASLAMSFTSLNTSEANISRYVSLLIGRFLRLYKIFVLFFSFLFFFYF